MSRKIYCSYGHRHEANWLVGSQGFGQVASPSEAALLLIGGGADIDATLYTDKISKYTGHFVNDRDKTEVADFKAAQDLGIKTIGICRGAQMICALSGGYLVQHVTNHCGDHDIEYLDGSVRGVSSLHHQMLFPYDLPKEDYEVLAWSRGNRSRMYVINDDLVYTADKLPFEGFKEPEIVWFKKTNALAIQGHPEFMYRYKEHAEDMEKITEIFELFYNDGLEKYVNSIKEAITNEQI